MPRYRFTNGSTGQTIEFDWNRVGPGGEEVDPTPADIEMEAAKQLQPQLPPAGRPAPPAKDPRPLAAMPAAERAATPSRPSQMIGRMGEIATQDFPVIGGPLRGVRDAIDAYGATADQRWQQSGAQPHVGRGLSSNMETAVSPPSSATGALNTVIPGPSNWEMGLQLLPLGIKGARMLRKAPDAPSFQVETTGYGSSGKDVGGVPMGVTRGSTPSSSALPVGPAPAPAPPAPPIVGGTAVGGPAARSAGLEAKEQAKALILAAKTEAEKSKAQAILSAMERAAQSDEEAAELAELRKLMSLGQTAQKHDELLAKAEGEIPATGGGGLPPPPTASPAAPAPPPAPPPPVAPPLPPISPEEAVAQARASMLPQNTPPPRPPVPRKPKSAPAAAVVPPAGPPAPTPVQPPPTPAAPAPAPSASGAAARDVAQGFVDRRKGGSLPGDISERRSAELLKQFGGRSEIPDPVRDPIVAQAAESMVAPIPAPAADWTADASSDLNNPVIKLIATLRGRGHNNLADLVESGQITPESAMTEALTAPAAPPAGIPTNADFPTRIDEALRPNAGFQALSPGERGVRYRELGGLDAELRKAFEPPPPPPPAPVDPGPMPTFSPIVETPVAVSDRPAGAATRAPRAPRQAPTLPPAKPAKATAVPAPAAPPPPKLFVMDDGSHYFMFDGETVPTGPFASQNDATIAAFNAYKKRGGTSMSAQVDPAAPPAEPPIPEPPPTDLTPRLRKGKGETGEINPKLLFAGARTALGAGTGAALNEDDPLSGALVGGFLGAAAPGIARRIGKNARAISQNPDTGIPAALKDFASAQYEGMLSGTAQATNVLGNIGSIATSPIIDAATGHFKRAGHAADVLGSPLQTGRTAWNAAKEAWRTAEGAGQVVDPDLPIMGPAGKALRAADAATKAVLGKMQLSPEEAVTRTFSGVPASESGRGLARLLQTTLGRQVTPFSRTGINLAESGLALSPARFFSQTLRDLYPTANAASYPGMSRFLNPFEYTAAAPAIAAGAYGLAGAPGIDNPAFNAVLGPVSAPLQVGRAYHDYQQYGGGGISDAVRAGVSQIPFLSDIGYTIENPERFARNWLARPIPQAAMALGDRTVRETSGGLFDAVKERVPGLRETLPPRHDFLGNTMQRNILGQYPEPQYRSNPLAARLAEAGLLRREQSPSLGGPSPTGRIQNAVIEDFLTSLPEAEAARLRPLMEAGSSFGNQTLDPHQQADLQQARGSSTNQILGQVVQSPTFQQLPKESQDILLRMLLTQAQNVGTQRFRGERLQEAAQGR